MFRTNETKVLKLLSDLMGDLYKIGTRIYSDEFNRLFIHQIADGFIIYSHFSDLGLVRPISIATALMQSTALRGGFTRAAISHGKMFDIRSLYHREIIDNLSDGRIRLGSGIMNIFTVMGNGLVNSYKLLMTKPKGPRLLLDGDLESRLKDIKISIIDRYSDHIGIDWIHSEISLVSNILTKIDIQPPSPKNIERIVRNNIASNDKLSIEWKENAERLIRGDPIA